MVKIQIILEEIKFKNRIVRGFSVSTVTKSDSALHRFSKSDKDPLYHSFTTPPSSFFNYHQPHRIISWFEFVVSGTHVWYKYNQTIQNVNPSLSPDLVSKQTKQYNFNQVIICDAESFTTVVNLF